MSSAIIQATGSHSSAYWVPSLSSVKTKASELVQRTLTASKDTTLRHLPELLLLGCDIAAGNEAVKSLTLANTVANAVCYALNRVGLLYSNAAPPRLLDPPQSEKDADLDHAASPDEARRKLAELESHQISREAVFERSCVTGDVEMLRLLIQMGISPDKKNADGETPLYLACLSQNAEIARMLVARGANPFLESIIMDSRITPFKLVENDPVLIRILTGTENHPAFKSIKDKHDFFAILFPPSINRLPQKWKKAVGKVPDSANLKKMQEELKRLIHLKAGLESFEVILILLWAQHPELGQINRLSEAEFNKLINDPLFSIEEILEVLLENHPVFAKAWELANQSESITLEEVSDEEFMYAGKTPFSKGFGADYHSTKHTIRIHQRMPLFEKIKSLMFETMNALQRRSFQNRILAAKAGKIGREEITLQSEWIERNSFHWSEDMVAMMRGKRKCKKWSFSRLWKAANTPLGSADPIVSHAGNYRRAWDTSYSAKYLAEHPDFLPRRLKELAAPQQEEKKRD